MIYFSKFNVHVLKIKLLISFNFSSTQISELGNVAFTGIYMRDPVETG